MKEVFKGVFLNPSIHFLRGFSDKDDSTPEFWDEVGNILDIGETINFPFKNFEVIINLHKIGLISIRENDIINLIYEHNLEESTDRLAYNIFYSFTGILNFYFLSNSDFPYRLPIESFSYDTVNKTYHRNNASERFMYATIHSNGYISNSVAKSQNLRNILGNSWTNGFIKKIKESAEIFIQEKILLEFSDEYYYLISSLYRNRQLAYNEGLLITGWTICEYLINHLFDRDITSEEKNQRLDYINDKDKYNWAFKSSNGKLRGYSELVRKADFNAKLKLNILKKEEIINSIIEIEEDKHDLYEALVKLRQDRNNFVHNPSGTKSLRILTKDNFKLFNEIYQCFIKLKEIIRNKA